MVLHCLLHGLVSHQVGVRPLQAYADEMKRLDEPVIESITNAEHRAEVWRRFKDMPLVPGAAAGIGSAGM